MKLHPFQEKPMIRMAWSLNTAIRPKFLKHSGLLDGIGLVTIDAENLLVPYKGDKLYRNIADIGKYLAGLGINACVISNTADGDRAKRIGDMLEIPALHKGMILHDGTVARSKMHPDMYQEAVDQVAFGENGPWAIHFDDQVKNYKGMCKVPEFAGLVWTVPRGVLKSHPGTLAARPFEVLGVVAAHYAFADDNYVYQPDMQGYDEAA